MAVVNCCVCFGEWWAAASVFFFVRVLDDGVIIFSVF